MYAIVDIAGQQYKVEKDQKIFVHRLEGKEGSKVDFDKVLLVDIDGKITVGEPLVNNIVVSASIVSHLKGDTVKVFKKKRRKGYKVLNGHRQFLTEIHIDDIGAGKTKTKTEPKTEAAKKTTPIKEVKAEAKTASETETKEAVKKSSDTKTKAAPKAKTESKETTKAKSTPKKTASDTKKSVSKPKVKAETNKAAAKKTTATKAAPKTKKEKDK